MPLYTTMTRGDVLAELGDLHRRQLDVDADRTLTVSRARALGLTWEEIGLELNMTRQSAWERWHHLDG